MAKDGSSNDSNKLNKLKLSLINSIINAPTKENIKQLLKSPILNDQDDTGNNGNSNEGNSRKGAESKPKETGLISHLFYKILLGIIALLVITTLVAVIVNFKLTFSEIILFIMLIVGIILPFFISISYVLEEKDQLKKYIPDWRPYLDIFMLGVIPIIPEMITVLPVVHYYKYVLNITNFVIGIPGISVPIGAITVIFVVMIIFGLFGYVEKYYLIGFIAKLKSANLK